VAGSAETPVGPPVKISGTAEQLLSRLPLLATKLCRALGVQHPRVPPRVGETVADMRTLHFAPWSAQNQYVSDSIYAEMNRLFPEASPTRSRSKRWCSAVGSILGLAYFGSLRDASGVVRCARAANREMPGNALVWSEIGEWAQYTEAVKPAHLPTSELAACLRRYPNNFLLQKARSHLLFLAGEPEAARQAAEHAVRCAVRSPNAWTLLADTFGEQAQAVRHGKFGVQMTPSEWRYCSQRYAEELAAALQAVRLDPAFAAAWKEVSSAAAFGGENRLADEAFWKALELDPYRQGTYRWGLQLYQPKWLNDRAKLVQVAQRAIKANGHEWNYPSRLEIAFNIHCAGLPELAPAMLWTPQERAELQAAIRRQK
jgi:tetratricopeptide (TPR) repeat protein